MPEGRRGGPEPRDWGPDEGASPDREGGRPRSRSRGSPEGQPANGSRRRRVSQSPAEQRVAGGGMSAGEAGSTGESGV